jgi:hypothetical protein
MPNLTVIETLKQPTNGDGSLKATIAPTRLVENYIDKNRLVEHTDGSFTLDSVTYQPKQAAITAAWLVANISCLNEAFRLAESGFCTKLQKDTADIIREKGIVKTKPLEGHVMTSAQWLQSCIDKLPELPAPDYESHAALIATITDSMTKAQILDIVAQAKSLVDVRVYTINDCTSEQQDKYYDLVSKERAILQATSALSVYLEDVESAPKTDNMLRGKYPVLTGTMPLFKQLVVEEKWEFIGSPVASTDGEYMTFTIRVI